MNQMSKVTKKLTSTLLAIVCVAVFMSMLPTVQVQAASPSLSAKSITLNLKQSKTLMDIPYQGLCMNTIQTEQVFLIR